MPHSSDALWYYQERWSSEGPANAWAMRRGAVIPGELAARELDRPRILDSASEEGPNAEARLSPADR